MNLSQYIGSQGFQTSEGFSQDGPILDWEVFVHKMKISRGWDFEKADAEWQKYEAQPMYHYDERGPMDKPLRLRIPSWLTATDHVDKVKQSYERKEFQQKTKEVKDMAEDTALQIKRELHKGFGSLPAAELKNLQELLSAAAITRASSSEVTGRSLLESHAKRLRIHEPDQGSPSPSKAAVPQFHPGPASKSAQNFTVAPFSGKAAGGVFDLRTTKLAMHRAWQKEIGQAEKKISGMVVQLGDTLFDALRADAVDEYDTALERLQMALLFLGSEASPVSTADAGYSIVPGKAGASYHKTGSMHSWSTSSPSCTLKGRSSRTRSRQTRASPLS